MCRYRGNIHNSGPPSRCCCTHGRSHFRSSGVSVMRVDSWELPLSAIPLCQLLPSHLGPPRPMLSNNCMSKDVLTALLERYMCPYQWSLLSIRMRSRSSMPSPVSSSVDLKLAVSYGFILQISDHCSVISLQTLEAGSIRYTCWHTHMQVENLEVISPLRVCQLPNF